MQGWLLRDISLRSLLWEGKQVDSINGCCCWVREHKFHLTFSFTIRIGAAGDLEILTQIQILHFSTPFTIIHYTLPKILFLLFFGSILSCEVCSASWYDSCPVSCSWKTPSVSSWFCERSPCFAYHPHSELFYDDCTGVYAIADIRG